MTEEKNR